MFVDTFALYFLIIKVKNLETNEAQNSRSRAIINNSLEDIAESHTTLKESTSKIRKRVLKLEKKLKSLLDKE